MGKKITRGISQEFAKAFKKSEIFELYKSKQDELIVGIRNNYLSIYYNCDSIAKVVFTYKTISCSINEYYLGETTRIDKKKNRYVKKDPKFLLDQYSSITERINKRLTSEKKAQSKLFTLNNQNIDSNWFCIDVEYNKQFVNIQERLEADFHARFDFIAISKKAPHRVALVELKYGRGSISGKSGIYKHVKDFSNFVDKGFFDSHLRKEIIEIIENQKDIGIAIPFELPKENNLLVPEFYFITLNNNKETPKHNSPKQTMAAYLFKKKQWGCIKLSTKDSVEKDFGDITKRDNPFHATFLFSSQTIDNLDIDDIIDGDYDERVEPK